MQPAARLSKNRHWNILLKAERSTRFSRANNMKIGMTSIGGSGSAHEPEANCENGEGDDEGENSDEELEFHDDAMNDNHETAVAAE